MEMIRTNSCNQMRCKHQGMTLIELILVVGIIGLLAAIVYPNYSDHIRKGHRKQAMADMAKIQLHLEQNYNDGYSTNGILTSGKCLDFCDGAEDRYELSVTLSRHGYLISATPKADKGQNKDQCSGSTYSQLTLAHTGESLPKNCWL